MLERFALEGLVTERDLAADRSGGGERNHFRHREAALGENCSISWPTLPVAPATATLKPDIVKILRSPCLPSRPSSADLLNPAARRGDAATPV